MNPSHDSWGRLVRRPRNSVSPESFRKSDRIVRDQKYLPFGNGRSYGDSCHHDDGLLIDPTKAPRIHVFDSTNGLLVCDAGVTLREILALVMEKGFFLPVTPGTSHVTIGGAIANDVHGKNHHTRGSFGAHVKSLVLRRSDGQSYECSPSINSELFRATVGGMGLTGFIERASIELMAVGSPNVRQSTHVFHSLDGYFKAIDAVDAAHEYSVAWLDQLARGSRLGRGLLLAGDHAYRGEGGPVIAPTEPRLSVPIQPPVSVLNRLTLTCFNQAYFFAGRRKAGETIVPWASYFYPLDGIGQWNRLYGPNGLFQHQSVYPAEEAARTTALLLECAQRHGQASFLTVLKRFGAQAQTGLMSFARPGFTLTLDFANQGERTRRCLDELDAIVMRAGGAINPYKDARMSAETFAMSFPNWHNLERMRDPKIVSDFWLRTAGKLSVPTQKSPGFWEKLRGFTRRGERELFKN